MQVGTTVQCTRDNGATWLAAIVVKDNGTSVNLTVFHPDGGTEQQNSITTTGTKRYQAIPV